MLLKAVEKVSYRRSGAFVALSFHFLLWYIKHVEDSGVWSTERMAGTSCLILVSSSSFSNALLDVLFRLPSFGYSN